MEKFRRWILKISLDIFDLIAFLVLVSGIILFIRFFVGTPYTVVGSSMLPTFQERDWIIVEKITQNFWTLERGDIIVFVPPGKTIPYIKRIIALPGEVVKFVDGKTYICNDSYGANNVSGTGVIASNGLVCEQLEEAYTPPYSSTEPRCGKDEFEISGGYFVMWDNRGFTNDSLCCFGLGCYRGANYIVPNNYLIGKVFVRLWPSFSTF